MAWSVVRPLQPAVVAFEVATSIVGNSYPVELPTSLRPASKEQIWAVAASGMPTLLVLSMNFIFRPADCAEVQRAACVVHKFRLASPMMDFSTRAQGAD